MNQDSEIKSLHHFVTDSIGTLLYSESFPVHDNIPKGIVSLIDLISDYREEGSTLFPEVILTTSIDIIGKQFPVLYKIFINKSKLEVNEFKNALKKCAPLAKEGWVIYIELGSEYITYGLISIDSSELSSSIYDHAVGNNKSETIEVPVLYIKNIGSSIVKLKTFTKELLIYLNLKDAQSTSDEHLSALIGHIIENVQPSVYEGLQSYLYKTFELSLRKSHGCLIGVVEDSEQVIENLKKRLPDAIYFQEPVDLSSLVYNHLENPTSESNTLLKSYKSIISGILMSDGITIFSNKAKVIAFNAFIEGAGTSPDDINKEGGARKRAFQIMCHSELFKICYYQSQDGPVEIGSKI